MRDFAYARAADADAAVNLLADRPDARLIAGGTDLLGLLKEDIEHPGLLVDISRTALTGVSAGPDGLVLGALTRLSDAAAHPLVRAACPALATALEKSASPQLRNLATLGGNVLQRTRCPYFRAETDLPCNKRTPGSGCAALTGHQRAAGLFGTSDACVATHPSDLAVALAALDATVLVRGARGERVLGIEALYAPADSPPHVEHRLEHAEMIIEIRVPATPLAALSRYLKVRERASYEFALVSAAVAVTVDGGTVSDVRIALGGVGPRPWRLRGAEQALRGGPLTPESVSDALAPELGGARTLPGNAFKVPLVRRTVVRALTGESP
ncbi:FAD binding domain-containing protein [Streptomyces sp. NPDC002690]